MDSKKIIEKLIKIAESQQKIIMKLAQAQPPPQSLPLPSGHPNHAEQIKQELDRTLPHFVFSVTLGRPNPNSNTYKVSFYEGALTDQNKDAVWPKVLEAVRKFDPNAGAESAVID